jgi:hypothetical protein
MLDRILDFLEVVHTSLYDTFIPIIGLLCLLIGLPLFGLVMMVSIGCSIEAHTDPFNPRKETSTICKYILR